MPTQEPLGPDGLPLNIPTSRSVAPTAGLRQEALSVLGRSGDERAGSIMALARVELEADTRAWQASSGDVRGHRVWLGVDGASLGVVNTHPAVYDALCDAVARAIARMPGHSLVELSLYWGLDPTPGPEQYRALPFQDASPADQESVQRNCLAYLRAADEERAVSWFALAAVSVLVDSRGVVVDLFVPPASPDLERSVEHALLALLRGRHNPAVRVVFHRG